MLNWLQPFSTFCFLDNHQYQVAPHTQECLIAAGVQRKLVISLDEMPLDSRDAFSLLQQFIDAKKDSWLFGHLGYDLKNQLEKLTSSHPDHIGFPDLYFFEPAILLRLNETDLIIQAEDPQSIYAAIDKATPPLSVKTSNLHIESRYSKEEYISVIRQLKERILRGDCYEINFCQEFYSDSVENEIAESKTIIDPLAVYKKLSDISPNPFSAFYRIEDKWLMCASPERFIKKQGTSILSQPIKGTSPRVTDDQESDQYQKDALRHSAKDRSENVMVVDLVRNDLAKVCAEGTVKVDELYGIYSFPQVHQMISTISGELKKEISFTDIIRNTFPMGSMTGAPKKRVMELIEEYEQTKRGIFSGALGYIDPSGDFDFNVIIRSMFYNEAKGYLSFLTGSGITFYSDPEQEWEECELKAAAMKKALREF